MNRILLITHSHIGEALLTTAKRTLNNQLPCPVDAINVSDTTDPEFLQHSLVNFVKQHAEDILILTDMFGSTPCNIARAIKGFEEKIKLLSGLNLPMLIRALNYAHEPLAVMAEKAFLGGRNGVCVCTSQEDKKISYDTQDCHHH